MQWSILLVVLPLCLAPITALVRHRLLAFLLTQTLTLGLFILSVCLLVSLIDGSQVHYELGGWAPPWGIAYELDTLNSLVALIICGIAFFTTLFGVKTVEDEIPEHLSGLFYAAFQLCILGLLGMALTGDIFNLFVFLEISSLSSYALIAMGKDRKALISSFNYLVLGTIGATFFLIGVGLLYAASGSLNMEDIAIRFHEFDDKQLVSTALVFIVIGMSLKAAIFPLHSWLPNAYTQAPSMISVFLAATATKVAIYVLIRCLFDVYPVEYWMAIVLPKILVGVGCIAIIYGSLRAVNQDNLKRLLAYSSVAQVGYMILGIGLLNETGMQATLLHLFNHGVMKAALFMVAGIFLTRTNTILLSELNGLGRDMKWTMLAMVIGGLSLIGVPGTAGFVSKWYLLRAIIETEQWWVLAATLLGSVLSVVYVWKMVESLYFQPKDKPHVHHVSSGQTAIGSTPLLMGVACWSLTLATLYFGFETHWLTEAASVASASLYSDFAAGIAK